MNVIEGCGRPIVGVAIQVSLLFALQASASIPATKCVAALSVEPVLSSAGQTTAAHQIDVRSLMLDGSVTEARTYQFADGRRKSDGVWTSNYDELGRLVKLENDPSLMPHRRIVATYDPRNRLTGRTAYHQEGATWVLDTAPSDGLPPDVTFLWDPIADRLVGIVEAGRSVETDALADAGLLRQYVHGDQGYDDPVEVLVAQGSTVKRYLPVVDEAGTGSIEAVLDGSTGNVVERVLYGDAYGGTPKYLQGPVVDQITLKVEKGADGQVKTVTVEGHLSERVVESSATDGLRLRTLTSSGGVAATAPGSPERTGLLVKDDGVEGGQVLKRPEHAARVGSRSAARCRPQTPPRAFEDRRYQTV